MRRALPWLLAAVVACGAGGSIAWRFLTEEPRFDFDAGSLRMDVVNATGMMRAGRAVADELLSRGYDIYSVLSTDKRLTHTTVVDLRDRSGRNARNIARSLAFRRHWWRIPYGPWLVPAVAVEIDSARFVDVRLTVGQDFQVFFPKAIPLH